MENNPENTVIRNLCRSKPIEVVQEMWIETHSLMREFQCENSENIRAVSLLLEESESLADENEKMRLLIARAMEYGVNGSRCYSASEACRTGEAMRDILSNAEAHGRRSRTVQPLVGSSGSEGQA